MHNFGKNVVYLPNYRYAPPTEEEVLDIMSRHREGQIRVQGSGHSWSGIVEATDVLLNLASLSNVTVEEGPAGPVARVGAGATLEKILSVLRATAFDLPTLGAITRQTIAGATATATHGTGHASLSSLVQAVKLACYDAKGDPFIKTISGGNELLAARASLGCMGVILELTLKVEPKFWMEEQMKAHELARVCFGRRGGVAPATVSALPVWMAVVRLPPATHHRAGFARSFALAVVPGI